ncbi:MAG: ATP-binding protein, partial [Proteobacteria bacterium]|nr:ATP-binding protein [Pseudomonadota bacterium]
LHKAGLDPRFFPWPPENDPTRAPYRGLKALEADDAGIFFGREAQTVAALDRMRGLREAAPPRFLAILGASGAGKSSFLRAGLLPRLQRDDRHFCALPVIRPERAAITGETGLVRALATMFERVSNGISQKQIEELIALGPPAVIRILARLANILRVPALPGEPPARPPTLVLSIDQGEELFNADASGQAAQLLDFIRALATTPDLNLIVLVSIRSDSYERLQTAPQLDGLRQETLSLPPMPRGAYETVINGPAQRLSQSGRNLIVEPALTQQLLADIEAGGGKDALPLLAFTLELLYANHGRDGRLTLTDYAVLGGIKGSIEVAVERALAAADADPRIPKDRDQRLALMRRAFIPWLAGTDLATNTVRRRVARMSEVPEEARPLVECLIAARLLSTDVTLDGTVTVEPAHEALLRQWGMLQGWLEEDFAAMAALAGVQRAARDWEANARDPGWLSHAAGRLEDAEASDARENLKGFLSDSEHAYLTACRVAENEQRNRELEEARKLAESRALTVRRTRIGLAVASALFVAASGIGWYATLQRDEAQRQETRARDEATRAQASLLVVRSREAKGTGNLALASRNALEGYRLRANTETRSNLLDVGLAISPHLEAVVPIASGTSVTALGWLGEDSVAVAGKEGRTTVLDTLTLRPDALPALTRTRTVPKVMFDAEDEAEIVALRALPGGLLMAVRNSGTIEVYPPGNAPPLSWTPPKRQNSHDYPHAAIAPDGRSLVLGGTNGAVFMQCAPITETATALSCAAEDAVPGQVTAVAYSPDGKTATVAFDDGTILTGGGDTPRQRARLIEPNVVVRGLAPSGKALAAMVQMTGSRATPGLALVLLNRLGNSWDMALRAPVNIG